MLDDPINLIVIHMLGSPRKIGFEISHVGSVYHYINGAAIVQVCMKLVPVLCSFEAGRIVQVLLTTFTTALILRLVSFHSSTGDCRYKTQNTEVRRQDLLDRIGGLGGARTNGFVHLPYFVANLRRHGNRPETFAFEAP